MAIPLRTVHRALACAATAALLAAGLAGAASAEVLDGKRFEGVFIPKGKTHGDADTLSFRNGRFHSSACDRYGYADASYTVVADGQAMRFEAETQSAKYGTLRWTGYVRGDRLDATAVMLQPGKAPVEHWVAAALKP